MILKSYRELKVWQRALDLVDEIYLLTRTFPDDKRYGLTSQLRRASVSIALNISEGYGRTHRGDYLRFLSMSSGSLCEVETLLIISGRQNLATKPKLNPIWKITQEVGKMLSALQKSLEKKA